MTRKWSLGLLAIGALMAAAPRVQAEKFIVQDGKANEKWDKVTGH